MINESFVPKLAKGSYMTWPFLLAMKQYAKVRICLHDGLYLYGVNARNFLHVFTGNRRIIGFYMHMLLYYKFIFEW